MQSKHLIFVAGLLACHSVLADDTTKQANANIVNAEGKAIGTAIFTEDTNGVKIVVDVRDLTPGQHGIHIHETGKCEGPDFKSAGGHFHMSTEHHGLSNTKGPHMGDLLNLKVGDKGTGKQEFVTKRITLGNGDHSVFKDGGTSIVIHAKADDEKSDPAGQSGDRIACGVISK